MIDWLLRPKPEPTIDLGDRELPLVIRRHARARRMVMRLAPDGSAVRVTMPQWGRTAEALAFARSRVDWLAGQLASMPAREAPVLGSSFSYRGRTLVIDWDRAHARTPLIADGSIRVGGPEQGLSARLARWLEKEALRLMARDLAHYCARGGHSVPELRLSRAQRRWGSCAADGTIRLNWRLVQAPDHVRRSVVAHEVAHLAHFHHGPAFHARLAEIFDDDLHAANRWLKQHGRSLYATFG